MHFRGNREWECGTGNYFSESKTNTIKHRSQQNSKERQTHHGLSRHAVTVLRLHCVLLLIDKK